MMLIRCAFAVLPPMYRRTVRWVPVEKLPLSGVYYSTAVLRRSGDSARDCSAFTTSSVVLCVVA